jgi:hypothetical protein
VAVFVHWAARCSLHSVLLLYRDPTACGCPTVSIAAHISCHTESTSAVLFTILELTFALVFDQLDNFQQESLHHKNTNTNISMLVNH